MKSLNMGMVIDFSVSGLPSLQSGNKEVEKLKTLAEQTKLGVKGLSKEIELFSKNMDKISSLQNQNSLIKNKLFNMRNLITAGVAGGGIKVAIDFESAMADVSKVVDFTNKEEEKLFANQIRHLTQDIPLAATELAAIAAAGGQMGIAKEQLIDFTTVVAKMSTAFDMGAEEAGESIAKLMNVYGLTLDEAKNLGDAMNHLSDNSASKARDITEVLGRIGGNAKMFGLAETQAAALSSAFLSLGKSPEVAGTAINRLLMQLSTAPEQGKDFQDSLKAIGYDAITLKETIMANPQAALSDFLNRLKEVKKEDQGKIFTGLMGMGFSDDLALLVGGLDQYKKALGEVSDKTKYADSMQREFQKRSETTANQLKLAKNSLQNVGITLGSILLPPLVKVLQAFAGAANTVANFAEKHQFLSKVIVYAATLFVAFKTATLLLALAKNSLTIATLRYTNATIASNIATAAGTRVTNGGTITFMKNFAAMGFAQRGSLLLNMGLNSLKGGVGAIGGAFKIFGTILSGVFRLLLLNPIGLIITLVVGIGVVLYRCYKKFEGFRNIVKNAWDTMKNAFSWSPLGLLARGIGAAIDFLEEKFQIVTKIKEGLKSVWGAIKWFFTDDEETTQTKQNTTSSSAVTATAGIDEYNIPAAYNNALPSESVALQTIGGGNVTVNLNGNFAIGSRPDGTFDFNQFKQELIKATKESIAMDARIAQNRNINK
jgi:TP901 family phage tail tape measure protein